MRPDPADHLVEATLAAARSLEAGKIITIETANQDGRFGFGTKVSLDGEIHPGFSGFIASKVFDYLKIQDGAAGSGERQCVVYVERGGFRQLMSQLSFTQTHSEVVVCVIGDAAVRRALELILELAQEWRDGKHRLFDGDGFICDDKGSVAVRIDAPKKHDDRIVRWIERVGAAITILYAAWHLFHFVH